MVSRVNSHNRSFLPPLLPGQRIRYFDGHRNWLPATVVSVGPEPRSYVIRTDRRQLFRRTRTHLRTVASSNTPISPATSPFRCWSTPIPDNTTSRRNGTTIIGNTSHKPPVPHSAAAASPLVHHPRFPSLPDLTIHDRPQHHQASNSTPTLLHQDFTSIRGTNIPGNSPCVPIHPQLTAVTGPPHDRPAFDTPATTDSVPRWPTTRSGRPHVPPLRYQNTTLLFGKNKM